MFLLHPLRQKESTNNSLWPVSSIGFDDMDSIYASPEDFKSMKHRDKARGLHLLEYFVTKCHEIGVLVFFSCCCIARILMLLFFIIVIIFLMNEC